MIKIADGYTKKTFTMRKNLMDFLVNDVFNDDAVDGNQAPNLIENVVDDQILGEEMRRRTIMRLSKQLRPRRPTANFNKGYQNKSVADQIVEEGYEES